jgi:hypothetical protein
MKSSARSLQRRGTFLESLQVTLRYTVSECCCGYVITAVKELPLCKIKPALRSLCTPTGLSQLNQPRRMQTRKANPGLN